MDERAAVGREISLDQLIELRAKTEAISKRLRTDLEDRLETLRPLLAPKLFLGDFVRGSEKLSVKEGERNFDAVRDAYMGVAAALSLPPKLEPPIEPIPNRPVLHPWEYSHSLEGGDTATIRSPVSWILTFASPIGLTEARRTTSGAERGAAGMKSFALNCLVMAALFGKNPGIGRLFAAMRFDAQVARVPELGSLDMIRLTAPLPTFRPTDRLVLQSVRLSGVPEFQELVDLEAASASLEDPLRPLLS
ncbi:MAG TPA: hypothetical protein VKF61_10220 [Candidatus Polarisedimenticolia bacterium]|nr:hypothetical protein [Candidatus Polarisedimenticolia bacterium]